MAEGSDETTLVAGDFSSWLAEMQAALRGERSADVPCGGCTACCTSSQFIHIAPDETETLSRIAGELLFPAPGLPRGHVVLGYDERGHCPMLVDNECSIYAHRPRTCRTYDCRIFPATGLAVDDKPLIARQARRWEFQFPTPADEVAYRAVRAAAKYLDEPGDALASTNPTQRAVMAVEVHPAFLVRDEKSGQPTVVAPDPGVVRDAVMRWRERKGAT